MSALDLNAIVYQAEVNHRLEHVEVYLGNFRMGGHSSVMAALWSLRALHDESRQVGREDLSEVCRRMERGILKLQKTPHEDSEDLVAEISGAVEHIRREARKACYGADEACCPEWADEVSTGQEHLRSVAAA